MYQCEQASYITNKKNIVMCQLLAPAPCPIVAPRFNVDVLCQDPFLCHYLHSRVHSRFILCQYTNNMQHIKVVFVGDSQVGKTYLLNKCAGCDPLDNSGQQSLMTTVEKHQFNIGLWDTSGKEEFDKLRPLSYPCTEVFYLCFSLVSNDSLENISRKWLPEIRHHMPGSIVILIGTKKDMRDDPQVLEQLQEKPISHDEGKRKAKDIDAYAYVECSAVTGEGVQEMVELAVVSVIHPIQRHSRRKRKCIIV